MIELKGKTAIVTGSSSGIGAAIARRLAQKGCNVLLTGLGADNLENERAKCEACGVKAYAVESDFSDFGSIDNLVNTINNLNLDIDIYVLNAGVSQREKGFDTGFDIDRKIMQINYFSSVYLIKSLKDKILHKDHVSIAVNTSISGLFGFPLRTAYAASKHALFGFFESLDLENDNIRVTFIIPGRINTQISKSALMGDGSAYAKMDSGQAKGMDVDECARIAVKAICRGRHRKLIGKSELLMAYIHKYCLGLYYKLARKVSAT